jgi:hypothetical protein
VFEHLTFEMYAILHYIRCFDILDLAAGLYDPLGDECVMIVINCLRHNTCFAPMVKIVPSV